MRTKTIRPFPTRPRPSGPNLYARATYRGSEVGNPTCPECGLRVANKPCGVCSMCYGRPGVPEKYGVKPRADKEPTQEEVDRMVAEQYECLPDWWNDETEKAIQEEA